MMVSKKGLPMVGLMAACLLLARVASGEAKPGEGREQENKHPRTIAQLPAAVQKTAKEQAVGATVRAVTTEVEAGNRVYEVEMTVNGRGKDILIAADGTLLVVETELTLESLPEAVRTTIVKNVTKGKIVRIESVAQSDTLAYYEAQVRASGKISEIKVRPSGHLIVESQEN